jgi:hypothetical protein
VWLKIGSQIPWLLSFIGKIIIIFPIDIEWPSSEFTPLGQNFYPSPITSLHGSARVWTAPRQEERAKALARK